MALTLLQPNVSAVMGGRIASVRKARNLAPTQLAEMLRNVLREGAAR
jgi:hypothetical protein